MSVLAVLAVCFLACLGPLAAGASAAGDANVSSCPNEASPGFRSYLPDCRAYEQVTPVFKDGTEPHLEFFSETGSSVLIRSLGTFAGVENDSETEGATYELSRSPSGWVIAPVSPPASAFPAQRLEAASPDLSRTLWVARSPSESVAAENLYVREADGVMVKIGSIIPPAAAVGPPSGEFQTFLYKNNNNYRDASADLSHVLFTIALGLQQGTSWPGDATDGQSSLYEYSGTGQAEPELVGVSGGHGSHALISTCSTWLGSFGSRDVYNAMSADGATVFFTADQASGCEGPVVNELFARLDGEETVPISEPTAAACAACNDGAPMAAAFAGASQDGSKVFFLTEQELLAGAHGMGLYEYDFDAPTHARVVRASLGSEAPAVQGVARVSEDGSHAYFVAQGRLSTGARGGGEVGGVEGPCLVELSPSERAEEVKAQEQEAKAEAVVDGAKCRPRLGGDNLYVFERDAAHPTGRVAFIATLCSGPETSGTLEGGVAQCPSARSDEIGVWGGADQRKVQATPDGRFLVFRSAGELTASDTSGVSQLFEYDALTGELVQLSREHAGYSAAVGSRASENEAEIPNQGYSSQTRPTEAAKAVVSHDGSRVVFTSQAALVGEAQEAAAAKASSAYEYRSSVAQGGSIGDGEAYLISDGASKVKAEAEAVDASGEDVFFLAADSLVPQDTDTQFDTYDARVDGGFLAPTPPADCTACAGGLYQPPETLTPASTTTTPATATPTPLAPPSPAPSSAPAKPKPRTLSARARLARALKACTRRPRRARRRCETAARARYQPPHPHHKKVSANTDPRSRR